MPEKDRAARSPHDREQEFFDEGDRALHSLLAAWDAPEVPASLGGRVTESYRGEMKEVSAMKKCPTCSEIYAAGFAYCPVDATPLGGVVIGDASAEIKRGAGGEYQLTMLEDAGLAHRLFASLTEVGRESRLTWPEFKRDPFGFTSRLVSGYGRLGWRFVSSPNVAAGLVTAILLVMSIVLSVVALDHYQFGQRAAEGDPTREDLEFRGMVSSVPEEQKKPDPGNAGMNKGDGGGSKTKFERPAGGGGGGRAEQLPASKGKLAQASIDVPQIVAPDPHPPAIKNPSLPTPATLDIDPKLAKFDPRPLPYGDPKSNSDVTSSGPGTGNGIGQGTGGGVGSGEGGGYGPGRGGNMGGGDRNIGGGGDGGGAGGGVFAAKDVTTKASIIFKPEPSYTEEARKNNITGTVVLRAILNASGQVTGVTPVQRLPYGLTEKAIAAAQRIKVTPATKDGRPVSQYVRIEYNFNMY
ncbi:MAG TPA: energy transducer TonB [Pyrinomonadaceae bacterium]|nr:energy transducer TonB [Pyrinomonadaceae bacterium]